MAVRRSTKGGEGAKAVSRRGIVVSSAYATKSAGGGKLSETSRAVLRNEARSHTGQKAPVSGIYEPTSRGRGIAVSKGDTLPPSKGEGTDYRPVRPTR